MKVKLVTSLAWEGEHKEAGKPLEVSDVDAAWLISRGRAVPWADANEVDADKRAAKPKATRKKEKK